MEQSAGGPAGRAAEEERNMLSIVDRRGGRPSFAPAAVVVLAATCLAQVRLGPEDLPDFPPRPTGQDDPAAVERWEQARKAQEAGPAAALATVRIDPGTLRGREGFFRVGRSVNGFWWLIDPDGKPFCYKGVCAVNRAGTMGGRRAVPGPYAKTIDRKYDYAKGPERFAATQIARLRAWGFNALGAWTTEEFFDQGMAYTEIMDFWYMGRWVQSWGRRGIPDIFDPQWRAMVDARSRALCTPRRGSKLLVGYFLENEIGFAAPRRGPSANKFEPIGRGREHAVVPLLQLCLGLEADRPACQAAWEFVLKRRGASLADVAKAWDVPLTSRGAVREWTQAGKALYTKGYLDDCWAWVQHYVDGYAKIAAQAVRRYDPNHLILGVRWGGPPSAVELLAMKPYIDVLSANNYQEAFHERMDIYWRAAEQPMLDGEFAWHGYTFHHISHLRQAPPRPAELRGMHFRGHRAVCRALAQPALMGYTWYRWVKPTNGPLTCGLVDFDDRPNAHLVEQLKLVNARAEHVRAAADRAAGEAPGPIDGTVNLTLQVDWNGLGQAALNRDETRLTIPCQAGRWAEELPGGKGKVLTAETTGDAVRLVVAAPDRRGAERRFELKLKRRGAVLRGRVTARVGGATHDGWALGFIE